MKVYSHILLPTDFSELSDTAVQRAKALSHCCDSHLTVIHVVDYVPPAYVAPELPPDLASKEVLEQHARERLSTWVAEQGLEGCTQLLETGSARSKIVAAARNNAVDLIVMGTHGQRGLARILGSTTAAVMHDAECDVLAVRTASN